MTTGPVFGQIANDVLVGLNVDLIKSNSSGYFQRIQTGFEGNYFLSEKFTGSAGVEYWSEGNQVSLALGGRWYPNPDAFVRVRGLIGADEISVGGGWAKPLNDNWRFEAIGEVFTGGNIMIRAGFAYLIKR
jgi:hypothetical protein